MGCCSLLSRDLPNPGIEPGSLALQMDSLLSEPPGKPSLVVCVLVTQLCLTLCNPIDCSLQGSSVHGILQARILEWVGLPFPPPGHLPDPGIEPESLASPALTGRFSATAPPGKPIFISCELHNGQVHPGEVN